jgi:hypothetical protein
MSNIIYLPNEYTLIKTKGGQQLNLNNKICKVEIPSKNTWIYFKFTEETDTSFGGIRLQQDSYDNNKFYLTDEKNKWHGIIKNGAFSKGRKIYIF